MYCSVFLDSLSTGNILIKNNQLIGIIDFGCMAIGDPACDLVIAWTFFKNKSRKIFKSKLDLDCATWARAKGWALQKVLITIASFKDKNCLEVKNQIQIISEILNERK